MSALRAALLATCLAGCLPGPRGDQAAPGVLVIAIDGLRADHVSHLGYDRQTTPILDALAAEGVSFRETFASAPQLLPAHIALLTGCEPYVARRIFPAEITAPDEKRWNVPSHVPRLAVEYLSAGYATAAFLDHPQLAPVYGLGPGFQRYFELDEDGDRPVERFLQWLRGLDRSQPWFAYVHFHDLERFWSDPDPRWARYFDERPELDEVPPVANADSICFAVPRSRWTGGSVTLGEYEAMYDGHLRRLDEVVDRILGGIRVDGRYADTTVSVVGTFGLQLGEAGLYLTSGFYSMADLHVPWIVRPGRSVGGKPPRGETVPALANTVDVVPTLLELSGLELPQGLHGRSQAPWVVGDRPREPIRRYALATCGLYEGCVLIGGRWCLEYITREKVVDSRINLSLWGEADRGHGEDQLAARRIRFYDRLADPHPPLAAEPVEGVGPFTEYKARAKRWFIRIKRTREILQAPRLRADPEDEATLRELQDLGYLGMDFPWPER